jgi:hypothetical protein
MTRTSPSYSHADYTPAFVTSRSANALAVVPGRVGASSDGPHITVHVVPHSVIVQPVAGHWTAHTVALAQLTVVVDDVCA